MTQRRFKIVATLLGLGLGMAALPGASQAQFLGNGGGWGGGNGWGDGGGWDGMAPGQIRRSIVQQGFRVIAPIHRNGNIFVADVVDNRGRRERLIVAAADAQILQRFLVDDGRGPGALPRGSDTARQDFDNQGLVPPADIPDTDRRFARPVDGDSRPRRFGDLGADDGAGDSPPSVLPMPTLKRSTMPPIRTVKPSRPQVADRSPDMGEPGREPAAVNSVPLAPVTPQPAVTPAIPVVKAAPIPKAPASRAAAIASRPEPATAAPSPRAPAAEPPAARPTVTEGRHPVDPLAIPGSAERGSTPPVRSVSSAITGAPPTTAAPNPVTPNPATPKSAAPKAADVPVAPLD